MKTIAVPYLVKTQLEEKIRARYEIAPDAAEHLGRVFQTLYREPFKAVIREYLSNALDAHTVAKQTQPVDLYLSPSSLIIQDYGIGLTLEEAEALLCRYGATGHQKRGDENQIGGFGLGAKSAFSVTRNFSYDIVSPDGRFRHVWECHLDDKLVAWASCVLTEACARSPGVRVTIPLPSLSTKDLMAGLQYLLIWQMMDPRFRIHLVDLKIIDLPAHRVHTELSWELTHVLPLTPPTPVTVEVENASHTIHLQLLFIPVEEYYWQLFNCRTQEFFYTSLLSPVGFTIPRSPMHFNWFSGGVPYHVDLVLGELDEVDFCIAPIISAPPGLLPLTPSREDVLQCAYTQHLVAQISILARRHLRDWLKGITPDVVQRLWQQTPFYYIIHRFLREHRQEAELDWFNKEGVQLVPHLKLRLDGTLVYQED